MLFILALIFIVPSVAFFAYIISLHTEQVIFGLKFLFRSFYMFTNKEIPAGSPLEDWQMICAAIAGVLIVVGIILYLVGVSKTGYKPFGGLHFYISIFCVGIAIVPVLAITLIAEKMEQDNMLVFLEKYAMMTKIMLIIGVILLLINFIVMTARRGVLMVLAYPAHIITGLIVSFIIVAVIYTLFMLIAIAIMFIIGAGLGKGQQNTGRTLVINGIEYVVKTDENGDILYEYDRYGNKYVVDKNGNKHEI